MQSDAPNNDHYTLIPIGIVHSPFSDRSSMPIQASMSQARGKIEILPAYAEGLSDIEGFSDLILIYVFHLSAGYTLRVTPFLDDQKHGVFATRFPRRPNPIGLSIVRLLRRDGNMLEIEGVDVLDKTPLLDIKPYIPDFDIRRNVRTGWYAHRRIKP